MGEVVDLSERARLPRIRRKLCFFTISAMRVSDRQVALRAEGLSEAGEALALDALLAAEEDLVERACDPEFLDFLKSALDQDLWLSNLVSKI